MMESLIHLLILLSSLDFRVCRVTAFHIQSHIRSTNALTTNRKHVIISQQHKNIPRYGRKHRESLYTNVQQQQHLIPQRLLWMGLGMNDHHNEHEVTTSHPTTITTTNRMMNIQIEYCTGCKWNLRTHWMAQELLDHYSNNRENEEGMVGVVDVTVIPSTIAGTFRIVAIGNHSDDDDVTEIAKEATTTSFTTIWDRTIDIGFPELEELLERINEYYKMAAVTSTTTTTIKVESSEVETPTTTTNITAADQIMKHSPPQPHISIQYSHPKDVFRASYIGQEILSTFYDEVKAVSYVVEVELLQKSEEDEIIPSTTISSTVLPKNTSSSSSSQFKILLNGSILLYTYNNNSDRNRRFIPIKELKQLIRDQINPNKHLGHSDNNNNNNNVTVVTPPLSSVTTDMTVHDNDGDDENDDDDDAAAAMARNHFGVA